MIPRSERGIDKIKYLSLKKNIYNFLEAIVTHFKFNLKFYLKHRNKFH